MISNKLCFNMSMKKTLLIIVLPFLYLNTFGQDERGSVPLNNNSAASSGKIRAVIVGVSDYNNLPDGKQLNYADDDAKEFYEFLIQQPNVEKDNVVLLVDDKAVLPEVDNAIRQQMRNAEEGDTFIFFFAGHGDVQKSIDTGFLLLHDVNLG
jgi:uncharacterized caspase-like protein